MPRGAKIDREATAIARAGALYLKANLDAGHLELTKITDRRSFVTTTGHLRLYGRDMGELRKQVYKENPCCSECGVLTNLDAHLVDPLRAELAHIVRRGGAHLGCDCRHNVQIKCRRHHRGPEGEHP